MRRERILSMKNILQPLGNWLKTIFEEQKNTSHKNSIAVLDGVRAIAILLVICYHVGHSTIDAFAYSFGGPLTMSVLTAGSSGVTHFFVLSGLFLFMPYAKALLTDKPWPLARVFYMRRALRILPGYYVSLFVLILLNNRSYLHYNHITQIFQFLTLFMDSSQDTWRKINGPYWTLAIEWQFYLILPLLVLLFAWIVKRFPGQARMRVTVVCLVGTIIWALIIRRWGDYYVSHPSATFLVPRYVLQWVLFFSYGVTGKYTEDFAVGMLIGLCYIYAQQVGPESQFTRRAQKLSLWFWGFGILGLVFSAMWLYHVNYRGWPFLIENLSLYPNFSELVCSLGYGSCVFAILFGPRELKRPFEWAWLRWIGLMSHSLYIWHLPLMALFLTRIAPSLARSITWRLYIYTWIWVLLVVFPFCLLTYIWIEKPWIKLSDRWRKTLERRARSGEEAR